MNILKHFENNKINDYIIFSLKDDEWDDFFYKLPAEYKNCFISDNDLQKRIKIFSSTKEKEFSEILPTQGNIKSGDFGEILSYFIFKELHKKEKINGPKKWRWKLNQNVPAPYSDVILFSIKNDKYTKEDLLISIESKMKATKKNYSTSFLASPKENVLIQRAINGAEQDCVSRIANSLNWLRKKYKDEALKDGEQKNSFVQLVKNINRFIQSEKYGPYTKQVKAIAFVDKELFDYEAEQKITIPTRPGMNLEIYIVKIKNLQSMYEKIYSEIPKL